MIAGKSFGSPNGVINLARVLELTLQDEEAEDFETFYQNYLERIRWYVEALAAQEAPVGMAASSFTLADLFQ